MAASCAPRCGTSGAGRASRFHAGEGVGTITLEGLQLPPGEAAINTVPRRMIADALSEIAGHLPDVAVTISIPGGEELAKRTMNARLGIVGGLSILGTTGIVVPYSCSAWIHSIHRGIDVARAAGLTHIAAATGSTSERAVQVLHGLPEIALIDMGDFVGGTLKYLRRHPVPRLTLAGGFAKLAKLGQGALDLHSGRSPPRSGEAGRSCGGDRRARRACRADPGGQHREPDPGSIAGSRLPRGGRGCHRGPCRSSGDCRAGHCDRRDRRRPARRNRW